LGNEGPEERDPRSAESGTEGINSDEEGKSGQREKKGAVRGQKKGEGRHRDVNVGGKGKEAEKRRASDRGWERLVL